MTDISYKELADRFIERDNNAVGQMNATIGYGFGYGPTESQRLSFLEGRVQDLSRVVMHLLEKLEKETNKEEK